MFHKIPLAMVRSGFELSCAGKRQCRLGWVKYSCALTLLHRILNRGINFNYDAIASMPGYGLRHNDSNAAGIHTVEDQLPLIVASRNGGQLEYLRFGKNVGMEADRHHVAASDAQFYSGAEWAIRLAGLGTSTQAGIYQGVNNKFTG